MRHLTRLLAVMGGLLGLAAPAQPASPTAWGESAMEKVRPHRAPGAQPRVELLAARNEFVSFQVGLHGGATGWRDVRARLPSLEGPIRIEGADIVLYRQAFLHITTPTTPDSEEGLWPDGLVPDVDETVREQRGAFPMDVPAAEARALWVDVHVPLHAPPGEYRGTVEVTGEGHAAQVEVHLTVVDALMPSTASLRSNFNLHLGNVCLAFTGQRECSDEDQRRFAGDFVRLAIEHRVSVSIPFDTAALNGEGGLNTFWAPWLTGAVPSRLPGAQLTSVRYTGPMEGAQLSAFAAQVESRGWLELAHNFVGDEPPWHSTVEEVRANAILARQAAPRVRTLITSYLEYLDRYGLTEHIDILAVMLNYLDAPYAPFEGVRVQQYAAFLAPPQRELWLYQACMSHGCDPANPVPENQPGQGWPSYAVDRSGAKGRAMEWVSFLMGVTGELYYETVNKLPSAWTDQYSYSGNGDGTLFYPGTPTVIGGTTNVPLPSMRLKLIRLGMQDYEWLKAVSDAGDPEFARQVARTLIPASWMVPDDGQAFEQARRQLIHRYLELTGVEASPLVRGGFPPTRPGMSPR